MQLGVILMIARLGPGAKGAESALRAVLAEPPNQDAPSDFIHPAAAEAVCRVDRQADDAIAVLIAALSADFHGPENS
jgi:hypothetical protein